jgi:hypothetical protein
VPRDEFAVTGLMAIELKAWLARNQRLKQRLALDERQPGYVPTVELDGPLRDFPPPAAAYATTCRRMGPACSADLGRQTSVRRCPSAGTYGPCSSTAQCVEVSLGSRNDLDNATVV